MDASTEHRAVLLSEAVAALAVRAEGQYLDATYGRGGHAAALLECLGGGGGLWVLDRDPEAVAAARAHLGGDSRVRVVQGDFSMLGEITAQYGPADGFDGVLIDLGVSSPQLEKPERGFSFSRDGPLDMRMDPQAGPSAADWLATADQAEIARVLWQLGEERYARRIARAIVRARSQAPIEGTLRLAEIVSRAVPRRDGDRHPATRTFQAIRMHINSELEALDAALAAVPAVLRPGGRFVAISFHSLEDRRVKRALRAHAGTTTGACRDARGQPLPEPAEGHVAPTMRLVGRPVVPGEAESRSNPRARSARLRVAERVA